MVNNEMNRSWDHEHTLLINSISKQQHRFIIADETHALSAIAVERGRAADRSEGHGERGGNSPKAGAARHCNADPRRSFRSSIRHYDGSEYLLLDWSRLRSRFHTGRLGLRRHLTDTSSSRTMFDPLT